jgi:hypothetical protein
MLGFFGIKGAIKTGEHYPARVGPSQPGQQVDGGSFASSVRTEKAKQLAALDIE